MSNYVKAIRKVANDSIIALAGSDRMAMTEKCYEIGYKSFSWNNDIYVINEDKSANG